ncbi:MAG: segregation/condensation protein A [Ruminococcus sp.]|nr:segregation/condensation protein A [Ruminococcus sp.]
MEKISFKLEVFEGPMELLLSLITKHQLDIYDIEISSLLKQYLIYLEQAREHDLELAGEFLEMAARLILIKTVSLLPKPNEAEKEKEALQGALIEYALCKQASDILRKRYLGDKIFVRKPMKINIPARYELKHEPNDLCKVFIAMGKKMIKEEKRPTDKLQAVVNRGFVSVMSKVIYILRSLHRNEHVYLDAMYSEIRERSARVALFLAVLELTKHGKIYISDDNTYLFRRDGKYRAEASETYEEEETWNINT